MRSLSIQAALIILCLTLFLVKSPDFARLYILAANGKYFLNLYNDLVMPLLNFLICPYSSLVRVKPSGGLKRRSLQTSTSTGIFEKIA
ncbi:hypothetical protein V1524DRAFT_444112 [Lipomyces starkeyi]